MDIASLIVVGSIFIIIIIGLGIIVLHNLRENATLKYEFVTIIAHKFRTPLSHIKYVSEMLIESEKDSLQLENIKELQNSNNQLIGLTGTLIELTESRNRSRTLYAFERIPLCQTVRIVSDAIRLLFQEKNISFSATCPDDEIYVLSNKTRLEYVLQTILENAYTYTPSGGRVDITIGSSRHSAFISVTDNGIGIEAKDLSHIFSKFHRAKNAKTFDTEGLGVGLYLAKSVMKRLRGKIQAFSKGKDKGSTFVLTLPLARKTTSKDQATSSSTPSLSARIPM